MLLERDIKALLIDWLFDKGLIDDAVVVNEMVVANWSRRADIAVANGRLYGFEIKSQFDTLKRLSGQVESFQAHFDKVVVVAASKFIKKIEKDYPPEIGILEVYELSGRHRIRQVRAGRIIEVKDISKLTSLITKSELERFVRQRRADILPGCSRAELVMACESMKTRDLRAYVLACIKQRYIKPFSDFLEKRRTLATAECIDILSKTARMRASIDQRAAIYSAGYSRPSRKSLPIDLSALGVPAEALDFEMPQTVLARRTR